MRINRWLKWGLVVVVACFVVEGVLRLTLQKLAGTNYWRSSAPLPKLPPLQKHVDRIAAQKVAEEILYMFTFDPGKMPIAWRGRNNWWFVTDEDGTIRPIPGPMGNMPPIDVWMGICNQQWFDYLKKREKDFAYIASEAAALKANMATGQRFSRIPLDEASSFHLDDVDGRRNLLRRLNRSSANKEVWFDDEAKKAWEAFRDARARFAALELLLYQ
jgi:hypothetical protein